MGPHDTRFRVVFVCTGNICRSPMAEIVLRHYAQRAGLGHRILSTSAGTGDWHVGERAHEGTIAALNSRGLDGTMHRARQFTTAQLRDSDLIVALDRTHERVLRNWATEESDKDKVALLMGFDPHADGMLDVPDPYYAEQEMFDDVLGMIERAVKALFQQLEPAIRP